MNILAWILSGLLDIVFIGAGAVKLITPRDKLVQTPRMGWARSFTNPQIKIISALEVAGGIGVILPWLLDLAPVLTPVAGVGLAVIMIGAMVTNGRLGELKDALPVNLVLLLVVAVVVAVVRFAQL